MKIIPLSSHDQALGVMVDGREIRLAHLAKQGSEIAIQNLETVSLHHRLGKIKTPAAAAVGAMEDSSKDVFGFEDTSQHSDEMFEAHSEEGDLSALLINIFNKYLENRLPLAVNIPEGQATYFNFESDFGLKGKKLDERLREEISPLTGGSLEMATMDFFRSASGSLTTVVSEGNIPLIDELLEIRNFLPSAPQFRRANANEISLVNLLRLNMDLRPEETTAAIHIGNEFSRVIILRGDQPISFLQTIREGYQTPHICQTLFSKMLLEQEEAGISEFHQIVLSGEVGVPRAHDFFTKQFPDARVQLVTPGALSTQLLTAEQIAMFPNYAIPVALAWELLDRKDPRLIRTNLLPPRVREGQKLFRLSWHGMALLGAVFALMLLLSYQGIDRWSKIRSLDKSITRQQKEIELLQPDLLNIAQLQGQISGYRENLNFMDSLIVDPGKWSRLFSKFIQDFRSVNKIWIENIKSDPGGFTMVGKSMQRNRVPKLATLLPQVDLKRVTRVVNEQGEPIYEYELTAGIPAPDTARTPNTFQPGTDRVNTPGGAIAAETSPASEEAPSEMPSQLAAETAPQSSPAPGETIPPGTNEPAQAAVMQGPMPPPPESLNQNASVSDANGLYTNGISKVQSGDLAGAEQNFTSLLQQYPNSNRASAARYWLGECRYARHDYEAAATEFAASLTFEKNTKREAALLMLGLTYLKLGQDDKAKTQFESLLDEFPQGEFSQKARNFMTQLNTQG